MVADVIATQEGHKIMKDVKDYNKLLLDNAKTPLSPNPFWVTLKQSCHRIEKRDPLCLSFQRRLESINALNME
ncbi:hypothetical protein GCM10007384_11810 [Aquimarina muelleri]|uniref:Uncharacterized protein n=1 Tax=Aquimarina muelleri TaxID=279356 RepID=A0A918JUN0_9FLAO|nr:hypothetical protein GCM10007384_11810 [Aquimarina muelleri]